VARAYIGLGANLGDRAATLREAVRRLRALGEVVAVSALYETAPVGYREQPPFLNAALILDTSLSARELMAAMLAVERDLGRVRTFRNAPRTVDLDLLMVDDLVLETPGLTLPHPRFHERAFVLVPLAEIAPEAEHPTVRRSIAELAAALAPSDEVRIWPGQDWRAPQP
jgi:2-amino-4-hydroxy-6-hydroxymethyldihydropteridine diphosphokinase